MAQKMRALVIDDVTPASEARMSEVPVPSVRPGWVLVRVHGIGMNHSEQVLRLEEVRESYITKPVIPGIECVGEVADPSDSGFAVGQRVCALMGGMGRSFDGSYAEYALLPAHHVFAIPSAASGLAWDVLAAIPETFFTAWGSLFQCLRLEKGDRLLVRGASSGLGYAALQIAHALGCRTTATTHRDKYVELLKGQGADEVILDPEGSLAGRDVHFDKILELVGPKTLRESLRLLNDGGTCCDTGILGGMEVLDGFDPIKSIPNGCYLTSFFSNYPDQQTMTSIYEFVAKHGIRPLIAATFDFDHLLDAVAMQDRGGFQGKIVVTNEW